METLRIAEELERQTTQPKHGNVNRYSKDSGVVDIELLKPLTTQHQHDDDAPIHSECHSGTSLVGTCDGQSNVLLSFRQ